MAALHELDILDTPPEEDLDGLTRLAARALGVRSAAISLIDRDRQWFKARFAIPFEQTSRHIAFCDHTVAAMQTILVEDALADPRFRDNPLVTGEPGIRFYAGSPLVLSSGHCVGALCAIDTVPRRDISARDIEVLADCAKLAAQFIEARRGRRMGEIAAKVVHATSDAILAIDRVATIVYWNDAAERMFGYTRDQAIGQNVNLIVPEHFREGHQGRIENAAAGGPTRLIGNFVELEGRRADGGVFPIEISLAPWGAQEDEGGFAGIVRDISDRKALEADRQRSQAFLDTVIDNLPAMLFVKDSQTCRYLLLNRKAEEVTGRSIDSMIGKSDGQLFGRAGADFEMRDVLAATSDRPHVHESKFVRDDGEEVIMRTTRVRVDGPDRPGQYILGVGEDMTQFRRTEAENRRLARYDALTGLLNRATLEDELQGLVATYTPFAMLSMDLDRFKAVNDQFGHLAGDDTLEEVGKRLRELQQASGRIARVARIGGDEFVIVLTGESLREHAAQVAEEAIECLSMPIATRRGPVAIGASAGIVLFPRDGLTTDRLRENADLALYRAKNEGRGAACYFDNAMDEAVRDSRRLELDLRSAIELNQITLQYQPIVSALSGRMTSVEALARWDHRFRGHVSPERFISLAEDCGLIDELGRQLLYQACSDAKAWRPDLRLAVNLSPLQFRTGDLIEMVRETLRQTGLPPQRLLLEVTERLVIDDADRAFAQLEALHALGIHVAIDDFGVGHSSLNYFQRFPFDKVKIDKSFIAEVETSRAAKAIVQAVVGLGRELSMGVVAEGVERESQRQLLVDLGCTHLQGYLFSKALDADAVTYAEGGLSGPDRGAGIRAA